MKIAAFVTNADIVGHRVMARWTVVFDAGETLDAVPHLVLRRKTRDFEFDLDGRGGDQFIIYDSASFPPADNVVEVDLGTERVPDGGRATTIATSISADGPPSFEVIRRTRTITTDAVGELILLTDTILDVGAGPAGLDARTTYYYELANADDASFRARSQATATDTYSSARILYEQVPSVHRRHDVTLPASRETGEIPEAVPLNGQLRRFFDLFGAVTDHMRSRADGLRDLHDVDEVDHRLLPHLAEQVGWELNRSQPVPQQRHEIRYAPYLYELTGTPPGCLAWFKRLTGWDARLHEFWRNVFLTNDLGNPDDPDDHGSRTVDTTNAALIAAMGTVDDIADYSYDTEVGPDHWYAHNVVGFFAVPSEESATEIASKRTRVLTSADRFLPFNLRPVVVLDIPVETPTSEPAFALTQAADEGA